MKTSSDGVSSAFWLGLQSDNPLLCDMIELNDGFQTFRWAVSNEPLVSSGNTYSPFPGIAPNNYEYDVGLGVGLVDITFINSGMSALLQTFRFDMASMSVFRVFVQSPDLGRLQLWSGKLGDYSYNRNVINAQGRTRWNGLTPAWPFYNYNDDCQRRFGDAGCGFNTASVTVNSLVVTAYSGTVVRLASLAISTPGHYDRGRLMYRTGLNSGEIRAIRVQSSTALEISHRFPYAVSSGDVVAIWPGCRKRPFQDCGSKFNNSSAFFGFPWIPKQERAF